MKQRVVLIAAIKNGNEFLMVRRSENDSHRAGAWEFPGGELEPGENIREGLKREIREEVGISIEVDKPIWAWDFVIEQSKTQYLLIYFICVTKDNQIKLSEEHSDFKWLKLKQIREVEDLSQELRDALL